MFFRKAILIIHGFAGGTYDEEDLANFLELNRLYDVYQFTLPGHKKNLSKAKYEEWIKCCEEKVEWLQENGYRKVYLIGHSMGGVIATYLATKYKVVKKLILAAPAFQYIKDNSYKPNFTDSIKAAPKIVKTYGKSEIISRMLKLNLGAIKEFMELVETYYDYPKLVNCPILLLQGKNDNIVPISSSKYVYETVNSSVKKIVYLDGITHDLFCSNRSLEIFKIVQSFLKKSDSGEYDI